MGQGFTLSAPRRGEILDPGFKMTESCFEEDAKAIVYLIAVPNAELSQPASTPPQSRTGTNRHGKRVAHEPTSADARKRIKSAGQRDASDQTKAVSSSTFVTLPQEVHQLIFDHLEYIEDVVCLGLCSRYFWQQGRKELYNYYASFLAPWAGENIVCVGDYVEPGDFPPGLFSADEEEEYRHMMVTYPYDETPEPFTLHYLAHDEIAQRTQFSCKHTFYEILNNCGRRGDYGDPAFDATIKSMIMTDSDFYSVQDVWVLRNLTTQEFIRADTVALEPEFIHGPFIDGIGFGQVLLSRINWSASASTTFENSGQIHRGVWAGHRFDITTITRHEKQTTKTEWKDVGEEVMLEVATIWQEIEGPEWRNIVSARAREIHHRTPECPEWR